MSVAFYLLLATGLPFLGFLLLIFFGRRFAGFAGPVATVLVLGSLGLSVGGLMTWVGKAEFIESHYVEALTYRWLPLPAEVAARPVGMGAAPLGEDGMAGPTPAFSVGWLIDSLTPAMFVLVTLIAALVHLYSIVYMAGDGRLPRYFAYLGLLTSAMLAVLLSNSLLELFAFWQIAGVAGALLTGFWFERRGPAMGWLKMMLVNRIGDAAFLLGMGVLVYHVGAGGLTFYDAQGTSLLADSVRGALRVGSSEFLYFTGADGGAFLGLHWLTWVGLLLFGGAAAKAAQFPLHVWLADSVEAPAPVNAMIQSATMIVSGVYLVARIYPILTMDARLAIAVIGCATLVVAALLAIVQMDVRKVLAYATISQAGFIMLFLGSGGYVAGLLHLFVFGFFMAGMLLAAGWVVKTLKGQGDLKQMGGLWRRLPMTAVGFSLAGLALIGTPFFAGAYSEQFGLAGVEVYARALCAAAGVRAPMLLFYIPVAASFLTAFYMARCGWLMFGGKSRNEELAEQSHEPFLIVLPIGILAGLSVNLYEFLGLRKLVVKSLLPLGSGGPAVSPGYDLLDSSLQSLATRQGGYVFWACLAAIPAVLIYWNGFGWADRIRRLPVVNLVYYWLREKLFLDALYGGVGVGAMLVGSRVLGFVERFVWGGVVRLVLVVTYGLSDACGRIEGRISGGAARDRGGGAGSGCGGSGAFRKAISQAGKVVGAAGMRRAEVLKGDAVEA